MVIILHEFNLKYKKNIFIKVCDLAVLIHVYVVYVCTYISHNFEQMFIFSSLISVWANTRLLLYEAVSTLV